MSTTTTEAMDVLAQRVTYLEQVVDQDNTFLCDIFSMLIDAVVVRDDQVFADIINRIGAHLAEIRPPEDAS